MIITSQCTNYTMLRLALTTVRTALVAPHAPIIAAGAAARAGYATLTRRRRKAMAKSTALQQRQVLAFARLFDPLRVARAQVYQTLSYLGWEMLAGEVVGDGLVVDFTLREWYAALVLVEGAHYVLPGAPDASDDCGFGPGVPRTLASVPVVQPVPAAVSVPAALRVTTPAETPYARAPASWHNPVRGLVLDAETAARHAAIRARGWKLAVVPLPLWELAAAQARDAHVSRRDLLMSLTMDIAPFEARPEQLQSLAARGRRTPRGPTAGDSAAAAVEAMFRKAAEAVSGTEAPSAGVLVDAAGGGARQGERAALSDAAELSAAAVESGAGRNRRARSAARAKVAAATLLTVPH